MRSTDHHRLPVTKRQPQALTLMARGAGPIPERQQRLGDVAVGAHLQCLEPQSLPRRQFELACGGRTGVVAAGGSGDAQEVPHPPLTAIRQRSFQDLSARQLRAGSPDRRASHPRPFDRNLVPAGAYVVCNARAWARLSKRGDSPTRSRRSARSVNRPTRDASAVQLRDMSYLLVPWGRRSDVILAIDSRQLLGDDESSFARGDQPRMFSTLRPSLPPPRQRPRGAEPFEVHGPARRRSLCRLPDSCVWRTCH